MPTIQSQFIVTSDFSQVEACLVVEASGQWDQVLSLETTREVLAHAKVSPEELRALLCSAGSLGGAGLGPVGERSGVSAGKVRRDAAGLLARKALICLRDPRFAAFVRCVRAAASDVAEAASRTASAYLPPVARPEPVTLRFVSFALGDAFSGRGGPVLNLGDLFFLVHEKMEGSDEVRLRKTLRLITRIVAHELHHIGLGRVIGFPETPNGEWLLKFIVSEGIATVLMLPFTEDDAYYHERWAAHLGRLEQYVWDLSDALARSQERIPPDVWEKWVTNVGAAYYIGAGMTQAIEQAFGRKRLVEALAGGHESFFRSYNAAAAKWRLPALIGVE